MLASIQAERWLRIERVGLDSRKVGFFGNRSQLPRLLSEPVLLKGTASEPALSEVEWVP